MDAISCPRFAPTNQIHLFMVAACGLLLSITVTGICFTSEPIWKNALATVGALLPISTLPALIWHDRRQYEKRDTALILPWVVLLGTLIPVLTVLSARTRFPLRDGLFIELDQAIGFSVPAIMAWVSQHHIIKLVLDRSYVSLSWLLLPATLVPVLAGKRESAERFLVANTIAFLIALPVFTALPAIGPWVGYNFAGNPAQKACEASIVALQTGGPSGELGIICFPSFHTIWAVLSVVALWPFRSLRVPSSLLASLIVLSTVTTGWHYVSDVFAGLLFAGISLACADRFVRRIE